MIEQEKRGNKSTLLAQIYLIAPIEQIIISKEQTRHANLNSFQWLVSRLG